MVIGSYNGDFGEPKKGTTMETIGKDTERHKPGTLTPETSRTQNSSTLQPELLKLCNPTDPKSPHSLNKKS